MDILARYGGEEFVVVMPQAEMHGAKTIAERLRSGIENMDIAADGRILKITVSIGVATYLPATTAKTIAEFIDLADQALYDAKKSWRNRVETANL
jgi:diguanylate cyclase (GGDEF)-like protein